MSAYDVTSRADMEALASDLVITDRLQRACAVTFALRRGLLQSPPMMKLGLELATRRYGEARAMGKFAAFLATNEALDPLWISFQKALLQDRRSSLGERRDLHDHRAISDLVVFMSRMGWQSPRLKPDEGPPIMPSLR